MKSTSVKSSSDIPTLPALQMMNLQYTTNLLNINDVIQSYKHMYTFTAKYLNKLSECFMGANSVRSYSATISIVSRNSSD